MNHTGFWAWSLMVWFLSRCLYLCVCSSTAPATVHYNNLIADWRKLIIWFQAHTDQSQGKYKYFHCIVVNPSSTLNTTTCWRWCFTFLCDATQYLHIYRTLRVNSFSFFFHGRRRAKYDNLSRHVFGRAFGDTFYLFNSQNVSLGSTYLHTLVA